MWRSVWLNYKINQGGENINYEFRGKDVKSGEWVYGYLFKAGNKYIITKNLNYSIGTHFVIKDTISQYTNINSDGDARIFEGDIVVMRSVLSGRKDDFKGEVVFEDGQWIVDNGFGSMALYSEADLITIIGNIYDGEDV